jgi:hypothetical protein
MRLEAVPPSMEHHRPRNINNTYPGCARNIKDITIQILFQIHASQHRSNFDHPNKECSTQMISLDVHMEPRIADFAGVLGLFFRISQETNKQEISQSLKISNWAHREQLNPLKLRADSRLCFLKIRN